MIEIRLAESSDANAIVEVLYKAFGVYEHEYTAEAFNIVTPAAAEIISRFDEGPQWVAVKDGEIVGTVSVTVEEGDLYVRSMAVLPDAQGHGIGHSLLKAIDEYAVTTDFERIFLYTTYFSAGAKELYEKHGYAWVRDTTADEWYGVPGLEMDKKIERNKQNVVGS